MGKALKTLIKKAKLALRYTEPLLDFNSYYAFQKCLGFPVVCAVFEHHTGYSPNLKHPRTFNEKLTHRKLFCRDPIWIEVTDKATVRDWLLRRGLPEGLNLVPLIGIFDSPEQLSQATLPPSFIAKASWASGLNKLVYDLAAERDDLLTQAARWYLGAPQYGKHKLIWPAQFMPRRIVVEELLLGADEEPAADYKFFCFGGKVRFFHVDKSRYSRHRRALFYPDGRRLELEYRQPAVSETELPENLGKMMAVAEALSRHFDFIRVDLYTVDGAIYFGELTQTPVNGTIKLRPPHFDHLFGEMWDYQPSPPKARCIDGGQTVTDAACRQRQGVELPLAPSASGQER